MYLISNTANIISAIYLLIILVGIYHVTGESTENTRAYKYCAWVCFAGLVFDSLSYSIPACSSNSFLIGVVTYVSFTLFDFLMFGYGLYLTSYIKEKRGKISGVFLSLITLMCVLDFAYTLVGVISGKLFMVADGTVVLGPWYEYTSLIPTLCLCVCTVYVLKNVKYYGRTDAIILGSLTILQLPVALLWFFRVFYISGYVAYAMALTIIFVMIQFKMISETRMQVEVSNMLSVRDALTELKNRRGYVEYLSAVSPDANVCAIFCDINSLKTVNDTLGHEAGDKLIKKMSEILKKVFAGDEVFRISGDEFVVIIENEEEKTISRKLSELRQIILDHGRIASVGYSEGEGRNTLHIIREAEGKMYRDKTDYYRTTGQQRRSF